MNTPGCVLCPRMCGADRSATSPSGYCGMGWEMRAARIAPHLWEEPCVSGTKGSGTVFFAGCHEGCVYCQNREISRAGKTGSGIPGNDISPNELAKRCLRLQDAGVHNINLVTPTHFVPRIIETLKIAKAEGLHIPVVYNTGGYERVETIRMLDGLIDIYLSDFQHASNEKAMRYSYAPDYAYHAMAALQEMLRQTGGARFAGGLNSASYNAMCEAAETEEDYALPVMERGVIVRHLVLPGEEDDTRAVLKLLRENLTAEERNGMYLSIMNQYTPVLTGEDAARFPNLTRRVAEDAYEALVQETMSQGFENVFFQYGETASESFIPEWEAHG